MRTLVCICTLILLTVIQSVAQTTFNEYKAGHVFYVSLPNYMSRTTGLNEAAVIQFKNSVKDIAGFVIEDTKDELSLAQMTFSSLDEFFENFAKDFLAKEKKRTMSESKSQTIGDVKFIECDLSYYDKDLKTDIYYFVGAAETKDSFYKVICFGSMDTKEKYKPDFEKILFSIKD